MVDLAKLENEINALGEQIKSLKTCGADSNKEAIAAAVKDLLAAKKLYAESNNGMGVDGKPFEEPLTKAQQKAKAKAEKGKQQAGGGGGGGTADAAAASGGDGPEKEGDGPSLNEQKKAAKKAAKAQTAAAHKAGTAGTAATPAAGDAAAAAAAAPAAAPVKKGPPPAKAAAVATAGTNNTIISSSTSNLLSGQVQINPNVALTQRGVVAMAVAVMTNTITDLEIISDHRCRHPSLGMITEGVTGVPGLAEAVVTGDLAMARYLARRPAAAAANTQILPSSSNDGNAATLASIDAWVDYAQSLTLLDSEQSLRAIAMTLGNALQNRTYLVGHCITLADLALFAAAGFPTIQQTLDSVLKRLPEHAHVAARWLRMMAAHPALQEATQLCCGISHHAEADFGHLSLEALVPGMNPLEGAVTGRVVTRFPPEPSGYLHIGHAKAVLLNDYYARRYKGRLILRFDDTNPSKEKEEYQESIVADLAKLEVTPDQVTYTSDYFALMEEYAKILINKGLAFMDDTPQEQLKTERAERQDSKHRNTQTPQQALEYFDLMCSGKPEGSVWCLRAKIDMKSNNGTMRDPVFFRQNLEPHHRSGTTFKAYPTYDMACPIVDSLEGVTHALRTTEYNDRDEQYQWVLQALGLRRVRNHNFSRVNFEYTVLSKRKLTWFANNGYVTGWDDPRFPTVRGVVRRGIDVAALRSFMCAQGASRNIVNMVWNKFWAENKKEIDGKAKRFMAIDKEKHVRLVVTNGPKDGEFAYKETTYHPKDPAMGTRAMRISSQVLLENGDVEGILVDEQIVLLRWGVVKITKVLDGNDLQGEFIPDGDFKAAKRKIHWIADVQNNCAVVLHEFDNLVTKARLEEDDNFEDFINPNTLAMTEVIGDAGLKTLKEHEVIQLERRGYYRVDRPYINKDKPLMLFMVPDGKTKSMGGMTGKLAHR